MTGWWDERDKYLWQALGKESFDINDKLTDKQWADFVGQYAHMFAEMAGELAYELYLDWRGINADADIEEEE